MGRLSCFIVAGLIILVTLLPSPSVNAQTTRKLTLGCGTVYTINADGSELTRIFSEIWNYYPILSPDGQRIVWATHPNHQRARIEVINVDGTGRHRLTADEWNGEYFDALAPTWSPDGSHIAFYAVLFDKKFTMTKQGIFVMAADGTNYHQLSNEYASSLAWSPDGQYIAYSNDHTIYLMNADGGNPHPLWTSQATKEYNRGVAWTPDSRFITFVSNRDGDGDIYLMDIQGGNERQLTNNKTPEFSPAWSPDGQQLAFIAVRKGRMQAYIMNADGSNEHLLLKQTCYTVSWR